MLFDILLSSAKCINLVLCCSSCLLGSKFDVCLSVQQGIRAEPVWELLAYLPFTLPIDLMLGKGYVLQLVFHLRLVNPASNIIISVPPV